MRSDLLLVLALAAASVMVACGGDDDGRAMVVLTAEPVASSAIEVSPIPTASPSSTASTEPTAIPTPTETGSRPPGDGDRGAFVQGYGPAGARDLEVVAADVVVDDAAEVVAVFVRNGAVQLEIAWWDGREYQVGTSLDGGAATDVTDLRIRDINADGLVEIVVDHRAGDGRSGVTVWQVAGIRRVSGLVADGGCNSGRSTYGVVGAALQDRNGDGTQEIYATCDDAPLPRDQWTTDRYVWADGVYRFLPATVPTTTPLSDLDDPDDSG